MSHSSGKAQTSPVVALVAVAVVSLALGLYAGVLDSALPRSGDRDVADITLEQVIDRVAPAGVVRTDRLTDALEAGPTGYATNVTVFTDRRRYAAGPSPPEAADRASEVRGVHSGPARVRTGRLQVAVWR